MTSSTFTAPFWRQRNTHYRWPCKDMVVTGITNLQRHPEPRGHQRSETRCKSYEWGLLALQLQACVPTRQRVNELPSTNVYLSTEEDGDSFAMNGAPPESVGYCSQIWMRLMQTCSSNGFQMTLRRQMRVRKTSKS